MTKEIIRPVLWMDYIFSWDTGCIPLRPQKGKGLRRHDKWRPPCSASWNHPGKPSLCPKPAAVLPVLAGHRATSQPFSPPRLHCSFSDQRTLTSILSEAISLGPGQQSCQNLTFLSVLTGTWGGLRTCLWWWLRTKQASRLLMEIERPSAHPTAHTSSLLAPGCSFPTSWNITSKAHAWQPPPPRCPSSREGTGWKNTELGLRDQVPRLIMSPQAISRFFTQPGKRQALQPGPIVFSVCQTVDPAHQRLLASAGLPPRAAAGLTRPSPW
ncbi:uncharacterized protein LOC125912255 isoform X1 [Panthera uncia]|uniref:uncharacterized protein LOC125912255 isoform X1 n=1 Tax=Panthera uncia TaxID=29064 RepID=UPI0020FFB247|nr:uncharacterized protein LOC125912255 isoform X1 [Panthera uncia]